MTFAVGQVVRLKSGGPAMTITSGRALNDHIVECEWFAGNDLRRDAFDRVNLEIYVTPSFSTLSNPSVAFQPMQTPINPQFLTSPISTTHGF